MDEGMRKRGKRVLRGAAELLALGIAYYIFVRLTNLYIPCPFRLITGWRCPGCGISHCLVNLATGRWQDAFRENQFVLLLSPFALAYGAYRCYNYIVYDKEDYSIPEMAGCGIVLIAAIAFGVLRNLWQI